MEWSSEYTSPLELRTIQGEKKSKKKHKQHTTHVRVGICISLGSHFSSTILSRHSSIPWSLYMFFSPHSSGMSELVLIALLPQGKSYIEGEGGTKNHTTKIPFSSFIVPFSLPTPTAKHTSQQSSAKIPAQVQRSASCSSGIAANSKLNFQGTEVMILLSQWNRLTDFHPSILHVHLSPKGCLLAITARIRLFHNASSGGRKKVLPRPTAQNKASLEQATAVISQKKAEVLSY